MNWFFKKRQHATEKKGSAPAPGAVNRALARNGVADFFEAGKIPAIWKITTLLRFHGLHATIVAVEKNAFAVGFVLQDQTAPVAS